MSPFDLERELTQSGKKQLASEVPELIRRKQDEIYAALAEMEGGARPGRDRQRKKAGKIVAAASAAAFIAVLGSGFVSPAMAQTMKQIPVVGGIFKLADELGLRTAEEQGLVSNPEAYDEHDGTVLKIREVVFDGTLLSFSLQREGGDFEGGISDYKEVRSGGESKIAYEKGAIKDAEMFVDGVAMNSFPGAFRPDMTWEQSADDDAVLFHVFNNSNGSISNSAHLPDEFSFTLKITLEGFKDPFVITLPVHKQADRVTVSSGEMKAWNGLSMTVKELEFSPVSTILRLEVHGDHELTDAEKGNLLFEVVGKNGEKGKQIGGKGIYPDRKTATFEIVLDRFKEAPDSVIIKPYRPIFANPAATSGRYALDQNGEIRKSFMEGLNITVPIDPSHIDKLYNLQ
ncbi:DUF4179 domain-containing protein [Paenibacillus sp. VCA1]|uniref:DUF4179 domain-containing protein n=1 Tax=Paenibacillus sp. VCA1 TaxID=3039148 RepID=UPI0028717DB1|nr:DUF4179 domain-containing protein [Paenibacillus sp. VCA1]MDR9857138.1 DUF4179 domain-containing protein [Paenibacillus sp. VCA1]